MDDFALVTSGFLIDESSDSDYDYSLLSWGLITDIPIDYDPYRYVKLDRTKEDCLQLLPTTVNTISDKMPLEVGGKKSFRTNGRVQHDLKFISVRFRKKDSS